MCIRDSTKAVNAGGFYWTKVTLAFNFSARPFSKNSNGFIGTYKGYMFITKSLPQHFIFSRFCSQMNSCVSWCVLFIDHWRFSLYQYFANTVKNKVVIFSTLFRKFTPRNEFLKPFYQKSADDMQRCTTTPVSYTHLTLPTIYSV